VPGLWHALAGESDDVTSLPDVIEAFCEQLWMPDPGMVEIVLGTVAANRLPGDPVWTWLVGPPSSGKSETLASISRLPEVHRVSVFTEAGLLSGSPGNSGSGGLLIEIGERGLLVFNDLSVLLGEHGTTRPRIFGLMRELFDGDLIRQVGTEGGQRLRWKGKVGLLGAVTEAVDVLDIGLMGERIAYYRLPAIDVVEERQTGLFALENVGRQQEMRATIAETVESFFADLVLPDEIALPPVTGQDRLVDLATIGTRCRSPVVRDSYREIDLVPQPERVPRLLGQLAQLRAGLLAIGVRHDETWRLLAKVALDGMTGGRRRVLDTLTGRSLNRATSTVAGFAGLPVTTARRHLQDLTAIGVVERTGDFPETWRLSEWAADLWQRLDLPTAKGAP
jgi:hypothetical protein